MFEWLRLLTVFAGLLCIVKGISILVSVVRDNRINCEKNLVASTKGLSVYAGAHLFVGLWLSGWNSYQLVMSLI